MELLNLTTECPKFLYNFNFDHHYKDLFRLESRQMFGKEALNKMLFSDIAFDPSVSAFIKNRVEIISFANNYCDLLDDIKRKNIQMEDFKVEYLILEEDESTFISRGHILRDIGYCIEGNPNFLTPSFTYAICYAEQIWYFGVLKKQSNNWHKHKIKPRSFSNSIGMNIAKTLVNISSKGNKSQMLLDACCGVGTVILEARFSGYNIEGCDINLNACDFTKENLAYFNYVANIYCTDISELNKKYDAAIVDLPYNHFSYSDDTIALHIIRSTAQLTNRLVIVSISDIEPYIAKSGLKVVDFCTVVKRGKSKFTRNIWVCEKK